MSIRDVRPYLYYIGFWSTPLTFGRRDIEIGDKADVEDDYVWFGRQHLIQARMYKYG